MCLALRDLDLLKLGGGVGSLRLITGLGIAAFLVFSAFGRFFLGFNEISSL